MDVTFASPEWLWCLLLLLPLPLLRFWSQRRNRKGVPGLVSPRLRKELIVGAVQGRRWAIFSLQWLALGLLLVAMARPQWGYEDREIESEGRNVFIAIDTSRSMLARDLLPDRLTRAKLAAEDLVLALDSDRIGLIAFSGKAFIQAPLTIDHDAVIETIQQFDTELIPRGGTNLSSAVVLAVESLEKSGTKEGALILFSDGENLEEIEEDLESSIRAKAESVGLVVVTIGVGTVNGELIPEQDETGKPKPGVFVRDDEGTVVRSRLNPDALRKLSSQFGSGAYLDLGATTSVAEVVEKSLAQIEAVRTTGDSSRIKIERFLWPLGLALGLLLISWLFPLSLQILAFLFRRKSGANQSRPEARQKQPAASTAALVFLLLGFSSSGVPAQENERETEPSFAALQREEFESAIESYQKELSETVEEPLSPGKRAWLNLGLGSALYRVGNFNDAKSAFGKVLENNVDPGLGAKAHYNLGNSLFRSGQELLPPPPESGAEIPQIEDPRKEAIAEQWRSAIEHYEAALKMDTGNQRARHNLNVVKQRLEILEQEPPPEEEKEDEEKEDEEEEEKEDEEKEDEKEEEKKDEEKPEENQPDQPENPANPDQPPPNEDPENPPPPDKPGEPEKPEAPPESDPGQPEGNPPPKKPDQPREPNQQPPPPDPDGELGAQPDQPDARPPEAPPGEVSPQQVNPETGFSPEEARQKLRTLSDEDLEVRPAIRIPFRGEKFKNW